MTATDLPLVSDSIMHFDFTLPLSEVNTLVVTVVMTAERLVCVVYLLTNGPFAVWTGPGELLKGTGQLQQPGADRGHGHRSHQTAAPADQGAHNQIRSTRSCCI